MTMAAPFDNSRTAFLCIDYLLLLMIPFSRTALSQAPGSCQAQLVSLVPCAPFVQGIVQSPAEPCCHNLDQVGRQQPDCICMLLGNSDFNSFTINRTLALQLPQLCHLRDNAVVCAGAMGVPVPPIAPSERAPNPPAAQVSFGAKNESSIAASPVIQLALGPHIISSATSSQNKGRQLAVAMKLAPFGIIVTAILMAGLYL